METPARQALVAELIALLSKGNAHATFDEAVAGLTPAVWNQHVPEVPYTIWQVAEHMRIAQWDILEFSLDARHQSPEWPAGYWPARDAVADEQLWQRTLDQLAADRQRFIDLLQNPATDLLAPLPYGSGQNVLREALLIGDHNAYHAGEIILLRRLLKAWK
jgi:hypothetical protein